MRAAFKIAGTSRLSRQPRVTTYMNKLILAAALVFVAAAHAYDLPLGIPDPGFGLNDVAPSAPAAWTVEIPGYYYVDYTKGTDSGRTYGTPQSPRKTIPKPVPPGSRVELHGDYGVSESDKLLQGAGTAGTWKAGVSGPGWIIGSKPQRFPIKMQIKGSYLYLDNTTVGPGYPSGIKVGSEAVSYAADHIMIRNSEIIGDSVTKDSGLTIIGQSTAKVDHVLIYNCSVHDFGDMQTTIDQDATAGVVNVFSSYVWALKNTFSKCTAGFRVGGAFDYNDPADCHHIFVADCEAFNILQSGLWVKYAKNVVFSSNYVHDILNGAAGSPSKCIGAQYAPDGLWMIFNRLTAARYGIYVAATDGTPVTATWPIYCIGNVIWNTHHFSGSYDSKGGYGEAAIMTSGSKDRYIVNNTVYDCDGGYYSPNVATMHIVNNIFSEISEKNGYNLYLASTADSTITVANDLFFNDTGERIRWNTTVYSLPGFKVTTGKGAGSVVGNPLFANPNSADFALQATSPAVDKGSATLIGTLESLYSSTFGAPISMDLSGTPRPAGDGWDIGALEFGSSDSEVPAAPKNVSITPSS